MTRSLRARFVLLVATILVVVLGALGLLFVRVTRVEVAKLLAPPIDPASRELARATAQHIRDAGTGGLASWVESRSDGSRGAVVIVLGERVVASTEPELREGRAALLPDGGVRIDAGSITIMLRRATEVVDSGPDEVRIYALPPPERALEREDLFRPLQRWVALLVVAAALLGVALAIALVRRVTGPLEELTAAVRRMEGGDLSVRVGVGGGDEVGQLAEAFNALASRLERVEELRRTMVSDVAHELRAPITNLRCELESMQDGVRPIDRERVDSMHGEILSLAALVDDLQELALADAGQLRLQPARFALDGVLREQAGLFAIHAAERRVTIEVEAGRVDVEADERRVTQVVRNLLGNAIAHSPAGGTVSLRAGADDVRAWVEVLDDGSGVPSGAEELVFERFYRADPSRARATGGAGLGLAIAKTLVEAHRGQIAVSSSATGRSCFRVEIPVAFAGSDGQT